MLIFLKSEIVEYAKTNRTVDWKTNWKKNIAVKKRKIVEKKTKIDKSETKHMHTIDKKNMKKKIKTVEIETFIIADYYQINFFLFSFVSHEQRDFAWYEKMKCLHQHQIDVFSKSYFMNLMHDHWIYNDDCQLNFCSTILIEIWTFLIIVLM